MVSGRNTITALLILTFSCLVSSDVENFGKTFLEDVTMTVGEKKILDQFIQRVSPRLRVPYMKEEFFLIRWLRARNFNLDEAEKMLINHLKWWDETRMDTIEEEDWADIQRDYPIWLDIHDKEGRPVLYMNLGGWDLRKAAVTGNTERLLRYVSMYIERATTEVRKLGSENKNVSQAILIINAEEFNLITHGCLQCLPFVLRVVTLYENHFPGYANKIIVLNTPAAAFFIVDAARRVFHPETNRILRAYGLNKSHWQPVLDKYIDVSQIPVDLGGFNKLNGLEQDY